MVHANDLLRHSKSSHQEGGGFREANRDLRLGYGGCFMQPTAVIHVYVWAKYQDARTMGADPIVTLSLTEKGALLPSVLRTNNKFVADSRC